ncbi:MAG: helix-turn-helix domain-containing protein [Acutalibacteraceae bacterium]
MLRIKELREDKGISQKELAMRFKMSAGNLCDWEKGRTEPDIETLIRLADFFDVSVDYLIGRVDSDNAVRDRNSLTVTQSLLIDKITRADDTTVKTFAAILSAIEDK